MLFRFITNNNLSIINLLLFFQPPEYLFCFFYNTYISKNRVPLAKERTKIPMMVVSGRGVIGRILVKKQQNASAVHVPVGI